MFVCKCASGVNDRILLLLFNVYSNVKISYGRSGPAGFSRSVPTYIYIRPFVGEKKNQLVLGPSAPKYKTYDFISSDSQFAPYLPVPPFITTFPGRIFLLAVLFIIVQRPSFDIFRRTVYGITIKRRDYRTSDKGMKLVHSINYELRCTDQCLFSAGHTVQFQCTREPVSVFRYHLHRISICLTTRSVIFIPINDTQYELKSLVSIIIIMSITIIIVRVKCLVI